MGGIDLTKLGKAYKKVYEKISPVTIFFIVLSAVTIFIFIFFMIIPEQKSINKIQYDIKSTSSNIKISNEKIIPAYAKAKKFKEMKFEPKFALPKRDSLDRKNLSDLPNKFHTLALENNLKLSNKNLDLGFLKTKSKSISMYLELEGKLQDFRNYLIVIISLPFF